MAMRLLDTTSISLQYFQENEFPPYAILSHTWEKEEVSYQDMMTENPPTDREGYQKIVKACKEAQTRGFGYIWIDTCCIDKTSSAELSEAINSMFKWYEEAAECYAYLADVASNQLTTDDGFSRTVEFECSRWFTRGWTLQELLAPGKVLFFASDWSFIGDKHSLIDKLVTRTGIQKHYLYGLPIERGSISERMSWAAQRETTRAEDLAYCLLGIFGIHMPLLYGEGTKAFLRLQEEIMKVSDDQTLFAWEVPNAYAWSPFAPSPRAFFNSGNYLPDGIAPLSGTHSLSNRGLHMTVPLEHGSHIYAILACTPTNSPFQMVAIPINLRSQGYCVREVGKIRLIDRDKINYLGATEICFITKIEKFNSINQLRYEMPFHSVPVLIRKLPSSVITTSLVVEPRDAWIADWRTMYPGAIHGHFLLQFTNYRGNKFAAVILFDSDKPSKPPTVAVYKNESRTSNDYMPLPQVEMPFGNCFSFTFVFTRDTIYSPVLGIVRTLDINESNPEVERNRASIVQIV